MPEDTTISKLKGKRGRKRKAPPEDDDAENIIDYVGIEEVKLTHFMCYTDVKFVFSPHINVVVGPTKSGKTALLKGIILALGGEFVIQKNISLKKFVQTGKEQAKISVTIRNPNDSGNCCHDYGSRIRIERYITSAGQSSYKIKGLRGKVLSTSKDDLARILDELSIQVDNPLTFLTKDAVQSFMEHTVPTKNYQLFSKAIQLEKHAMLYELLKKANEEVKKNLEKKEKALIEVEKQHKIWEEKHKKLDIFNEHERKLHELEDEFLWSIAIEAEEEQNKLFEVKIICAKHLETSSGEKRKIDKERSQAFDKRKVLTDLSKKYEENVRKLEEENDDIMLQLKKFNRDMEMYQDDLEDCQKDRKEITSEMKNYKQQVEVAELRLCLLNECEERKLALNSEIEELRKSISACMECIDVNESEHQRARKRMEEYNCLIRDREIELQKMKTVSSEKLRYGPGMTELLQKIDLSLNSFSMKPIGPIGNYIKVLDKKWEFAVEKCLYELLPGFCCHSESDRDLLLKIMEDVPEMLSKPNIYVVHSFSEVHDVTERKVNCENFLSVLGVIHCDDQAVLNCLIEQAHIESIILIEDLATAMSLMMNNPPKNCLAAFTLTGDQLHCNPKYRVNFSKEYPAACYLGECYSAEDIETSESELFLLNNMAENLKRKMKQFNTNICQKKSIFESLKMELGKKMDLSSQNDDRMKEINAEENIEFDEEKLKEMSLWEEKLMDEERYCEKKCTQSRINHVTLYEAYERNTASLEEEKCNLRKTMEKLKECERDLIVFDERKRDSNRRVKERRQELKDLEELFQQAKTNAEVLKASASHLCGRIEPQKHSSYIRDELLKLRKTLKESNCAGREEINKNFVDWKTKVQKLKKEVEDLRLKKKRQEYLLPKQLERIEKIKVDNALQVTLWFQQYVVPRGHNLRLKIDHEKQLLEIEGKSKQPDSSEIHWTHQVSPEEKSYITASLLLALYQSAAVPLHILEENQVLMTAMQKAPSILDLALNKPRNQFIFLSPVEMPPSVYSSVKVHNLADMEQPLNQRNTRG